MTFTTDENVTLSANTRLPSFVADRQSAEAFFRSSWATPMGNQTKRKHEEFESTQVRNTQRRSAFFIEMSIAPEGEQRSLFARAHRCALAAPRAQRDLSFALLRGPLEERPARRSPSREEQGPKGILFMWHVHAFDKE